MKKPKYSEEVREEARQWAKDAVAAYALGRAAGASTQALEPAWTQYFYGHGRLKFWFGEETEGLPLPRGATWVSEFCWLPDTPPGAGDEWTSPIPLDWPVK